jgi:carboxypeptidase C (cathepsin A)
MLAASPLLAGTHLLPNSLTHLLAAGDVTERNYDLATPFFAADYTFDHLGLDPALRSHLSGAYYEAGHMMYVHPPSLVKLKSDIAQFIKSSATAGPAK